MSVARAAGVGLATYAVACNSIFGIDDLGPQPQVSSNVASAVASTGGITPSGGRGGSGGAGGAGGAGGSGLLCASDPQSVLGEDCPPPCSTCTNAGSCVISCGGILGGDCQGAIVACPEGRPCLVVCEAAQACKDAKVICPADYPCLVSCGTQAEACGKLTIDCSPTGRCAVDCAGDCSDAAMACGMNRCQATCADATQAPALDCGRSCDCIPC